MDRWRNRSPETNPMTVGELIERLGTYPTDMPIVCVGMDEAHFADVHPKGVYRAHIVPRQTMCGNYVDADEVAGGNEDGRPITRAELHGSLIEAVVIDHNPK